MIKNTKENKQDKEIIKINNVQEKYQNESTMISNDLLNNLLILK